MVPQTAFCRDLQSALDRIGFLTFPGGMFYPGADFNITKPKIENIDLNWYNHTVQNSFRESEAQV